MSDIRRPVSGKTLTEYLEETAPEVAAQIKKIIADPKHNYRDSHFAEKRPWQAGRRTNGI